MKKTILSLLVLALFAFGGCDLLDADTYNSKEKSVTVDKRTSFDTIYKEFKENKLRAEDKYKDNYYRVTAKVNSIGEAGLLNLKDETKLSMEIRVDGQRVAISATFNKFQKDNLKSISVGDTITFDGECYTANVWSDCRIVK